METAQRYLDEIIHLIVAYGASLVMAVIALIIGLWLVRKLKNLLKRTLSAKKVDPSLIPFLVSISDALLKIMLIISIASMIGIEMTSFVAVLGAAGLAVGLSLQGSLSNFAGGVLILILKPFKVGDFIEGAGHAGSVREIQIFYTFLTTPSGQEIVVPNSKLSNDSVTNYSFNPSRRFDMTFGISYSDDIDKAKSIVHELASQEERFLEDKGINVFIKELADSSVNVHLRAWTNNEDFWDIYNNFNEKVKKAFDAQGVNIPFPQRDIHIVEDTTR